MQKKSQQKPRRKNQTKPTCYFEPQKPQQQLGRPAKAPLQDGGAATSRPLPYTDTTRSFGTELTNIPNVHSQRRAVASLAHFPPGQPAQSLKLKDNEHSEVASCGQAPTAEVGH